MTKKVKIKRGLLFCWEFLFIFGRSLYVTASVDCYLLHENIYSETEVDTDKSIDFLHDWFSDSLKWLDSKSR